MDVINVNSITNDFGGGKGVFDLSLTVEKGEVYGFLGPNGAGKTTTIRNLMGFTRPQKGTCTINVPEKLDCFIHAEKIQQHLGYLAGEIAFIDDMKGDKLLDFLADMKGLTDRKRMYELIDMFELNVTGTVRKMSKGMKQKIGIINAFMTSPDILILDEPTSGLDPLMQNRFVELILEEKRRGTTILMSSHIFEEIERTCDRTAIINAGGLVAVEKLEDLKLKKNKKYVITFESPEVAASINLPGYKKLDVSGARVTFAVGNEVDLFIKALSEYTVADMSIETQSLEELFMHFYNSSTKNEGGII